MAPAAGPFSATEVAHGVDLDKPAVIAAVDTTDFLTSVEGLPAQLGDAIARAEAAQRLPTAKGITGIAVLGMGGSGISGEVCRAILAPRTPVPVATIRDYTLPEWVGGGTLCFAVSYSGNTEETLAGYAEAERRGARLVAVTTGGQLKDRATAAGHTLVELPAGLMPRAAIGYVALPALVIATRLGLAPGLVADLAEARDAVARRVAECSRDVPVESNAAKQLAHRLLGTLPVIWGAEGIAGVAAYRWKCQCNENAKAFAAAAAFPELNHNEVVGIHHPGAPASTLGVVLLRHAGEHPRIARRIVETAALLEPSVALMTEVWARGDSDLARLLDLVVLGDFTSTYLGILQGVDPAPIEAISRLKAALDR